MSITRTLTVVGYAVAVALALLCLVRFTRSLKALAQGKGRKSLFLAYLSAWTLTEIVVFVWFCLLHWQKNSGIYIALVGLVKAYTTGFERRWRNSIPDAEW